MGLKFKIKMIVVALVAAMVGITGASSALAYTDLLGAYQNGGTVVNSVYSNETLKISSQKCTMQLPEGYSSKNWLCQQDVDWFYLEPYQQAENVQTGYVYDGGPYGKKFWLENDRVYIGLNVEYY
jgi:hypothetical protein